MKKLIIFLLSLLLTLGSISFAFADTSIPSKVGELHQLNVPLYMQQKDYTCGPACIRMVLKKFGYTVSESTLATKAGSTESSGTYVYKVVETLNSYLGNKYAYYTTSNSNFNLKTIENIKAGYPVICHVAPAILPNYKNHPAPSGHYVVIKGYALQAGTTTSISVYYNDPNYNPKIYGSYDTPSFVMEQAINNNSGYYIAH